MTHSYFDLISIGCAPWKSDGSALAWHAEVEGIDVQESLLIFKYFQAPDTQECLALLIEADPGLSDRVRSLGSKTKPSEFKRTIAVVHERWTVGGASQALEEVAKTGKRGPKTEVFLMRCEQLKREMADKCNGGN